MDLKQNLNLPPVKLPANLVMPKLQRWHKFAFGGLIVFFGGIWLFLTLLVDGDAIARKFIASAKSATGYEVTYGDADVSVMPVPTVTLKNLKFSNDPKASSQNFLVTDSASVSINLMSLLMGDIQFSRIQLDKPQFQLERFEDGSTNWDFLEKLSDKNLSMKNGVDLVLEQGSLTYVDVVSNKVKNIERFSIGLDMRPTALTLGAGFVLDGKTVRVNGDFSVESFASIEDFSLKGELKATDSGNSELMYQGLVGRKDHFFTFDGATEAQFPDLKPWLFEAVSKDSQKIIGDSLPDAIPATFSANVKKSGPTMRVDSIAVKGQVTNGTGALVWTTGEIDKLQMALNFSALDFGNIVTKGEMLFSEGAFNRLFGMFLPDKVSAAVTIKAGKTHLGHVEAESLHLSATLDQQELVLNQASLDLPGDNHLLLFGIFKMAVDNQINFDGNVEAVGKSLSRFVDTLGLVSQTFLTGHTGEFRGKANLFLSPNYNIVSEIKFQAGPLLVAGGATIGTTQDSDAEVTLELNNIKLDGMLAFLIPTSPKDLGAIGTGFEDVKRNVSWLGQVEHRVLFNLVLPSYTLADRSGSGARFIVMLEPNRVTFRKADITLDDLQIKGNLIYDQTRRVPEVEGEVYLSYLNISSLFSEKTRISPVPRDNRQEVWDTEYFNVNFLKGYDTYVKVNIGNLIHPDFGISNLSAQLSSEDDKWNVENIEGNIWEGNLAGALTLDVSSVPGISAQLSVANVKADRMMDALIGQPSFNGILSVNTQIATSGLNMLGWVRNSMGHISFSGQNFAIKGFDVASLVQTVPIMRSVTDVVNTARVALLKNQSTFNVIEGFFNLEQGVLSTPEIKLRSKHATGTLKGQMDLLPWMMDMYVDFALTTLDPANYPVLRIFFKNSIDNPVITFDTRSLEAFIARKKIR